MGEELNDPVESLGDVLRSKLQAILWAGRWATLSDVALATIWGELGAQLKSGAGNSQQNPPRGGATWEIA